MLQNGQAAFWHCSFQKKQLHVVPHCADSIRRCRLLSLSLLLAFTAMAPRLCCLRNTLFSLRPQWRFLPLNIFNFARSAKNGCRPQLFQKGKGGVSRHGRLCCRFPLRKGTQDPQIALTKNLRRSSYSNEHIHINFSHGNYFRFWTFYWQALVEIYP